MTPRTGRPKSDNPRVNAVPIRLSDAELAEVQAAAERDEAQSVGGWIRESALLRARKRRR